MKKRKKLFYLLLTVMIGLSSCSSNELNLPTEKGEIKLNASVDTTLLTKSLGPINSAINVEFPIGIYANKEGRWVEGMGNIINNDAAVVEAKSPNAIRFGNGPYYYPVDGTAVNFFAFAPRGSVSQQAGNGTSPIVDIPITGKDDVMWTSAQGRKTQDGTVVQPALAFKHKLTQLQFKFLVNQADYPFTGNRVVSLKVRNQPNQIKMNVENGSYTASGSMDMEALSQKNQTDGILIANGVTDVQSPILTVPASGNEAYLITVVVRTAENSTTVQYNVKISVNAEMGKAHVINLTFLASGITVTSTVADWEEGQTGSGQIQ